MIAAPLARILIVDDEAAQMRATLEAAIRFKQLLPRIAAPLASRSAFVVGLALAVASLGAFAQGPESAPLGKLLITGSPTMAPMVAELGRRFSAQHPGVAIRVEAGNSSRAVADVLADRADIGMASRELASKERDLFAIPIARDGVAFVVHKDNPVGGLSRAQLLAVFTGTVTDWKTLGGAAGRIELVTRRQGPGALELVSQYLGIAPEAIKATHVVGDSPDLLRLVAANRNAIGFLSVAVLDRAGPMGERPKPLALEGAVPGVGSIRDGTWPLSRPLNLLTRRVPAGVARAFIEFALSPAARQVIVEHDFVPYVE